NLEVQHSFGSKSAVSANYVGNHGYDEILFSDLGNAFDRGNFPVASGLPSSAPLHSIRNLNSFDNGGVSSYHGLTLAFTQKAFYGLQFSANYTWSHALDIVSNGGVLQYSFNDAVGPVANPFNPRSLNYSNADYDVRHNFNANYVWVIPTHFKVVMNQIFGGWTLSGTFFTRTGYPFSIIDTGLTGAAFGNANGFAVGYSPLVTYTGATFDCPGHSQTTPCIDPASPQLVEDGSFGATRRNSFRGPKYFNSDFSVLKSFKFGERVGFGIGANMYNVFNHPNFGNPNHDLSGGSFGLSETTVEPPTSPYGSFVGSAVSGRVIQLRAQLTF